MFRPLAWTKTLAVGFSSLLAITLVPPLMLLFIRGRLRPESSNPVSRVTQALYLPVLKLCLRFPKTTVLLNLVFLVVTFPLAFKLGSQFMPPLFEGASLYMPTALPGISIGQATQLLQEQDRILRSFPEVATVFGSIGRSDSATDNAPLDMYDTTVMLKPRSEWRPGMTYEKLISEMDAKLQFPGLTNTWTMPIENRLDMELTGIKTPVGIKIQGPSLDGIEALGRESSTDSRGDAGDEIDLCRARRAGILHQRGSEPGGSGALWIDRRRCAARDHLRHRRREHRREYRGPRTLSHLRPLCARFSGRHSKARAGGDRDAFQRASAARRTRQDFVLEGAGDDPGRGCGAHRLRVSRSEHPGLWRLRLPGRQTPP